MYRSVADAGKAGRTGSLIDDESPIDVDTLAELQETCEKRHRFRIPTNTLLSPALFGRCFDRTKIAVVLAKVAVNEL